MSRIVRYELFLINSSIWSLSTTLDVLKCPRFSTSGEYSECSRLFQSSCYLVLSWWKTTHLWLGNSGRFHRLLPSIDPHRKSTWLNSMSDFAKGTRNTQWASNPTRYTAWYSHDLCYLFISFIDTHFGKQYILYRPRSLFSRIGIFVAFGKRNMLLLNRKEPKHHSDSRFQVFEIPYNAHMRYVGYLSDVLWWGMSSILIRVSIWSSWTAAGLLERFWSYRSQFPFQNVTKLLQAIVSAMSLSP